MPGFHLRFVTTMEETQDFELSIRHHSSVFYIRYSAKNIPTLFEERFRIFNDYYHRGDPSAADQLIKPFEPCMESLAPRHHQRELLSDYLYPPQFVLEATADPENERIVPLREFVDFLPPGTYMDRWPELEDLHDWVTNIYTSSQIRLACPEQDTRLGGPAFQVLVDSKPSFFKKATQTELRTYKQIQVALALGRITPDLRICHLHGVVIDSDDGTTTASGSDMGPVRGQRLVGVLLTFIETDDPRMGTLLDRVDGGSYSSPATLSRWARELDEIVARLHDAGIIWGDAKPENIVVDRDDNIWVTDFGGSYTEGWVDGKVAGTMEGDRQGVANIKAFLQQGRTHAC